MKEAYIFLSKDATLLRVFLKNDSDIYEEIKNIKDLHKFKSLWVCGEYFPLLKKSITSTTPETHLEALKAIKEEIEYLEKLPVINNVENFAVRFKNNFGYLHGHNDLHPDHFKVNALITVIMFSKVK